jgi:hypothetical protein
VAVALLVLPAPLLFTKELDLLEVLVLPAPELFAACEFKVFKLLLFPTRFFKGSDESKEGIAIYLLLAIKTKSTCVNTDTANFQ